MRAVNTPFQNKIANGEREKLEKGPPPTSHTPPLTPEFQRTSLGSGNKKMTE